MKNQVVTELSEISTQQYKAIRFIAMDQLHRNYGALRQADPENDLIVFIENQGSLTKRAWHIQRTFFLISSTRHFAETLAEEGFTTLYLKSESFEEGFEKLIQAFPVTKRLAAEPASHRRLALLEKFDFQLIENDFFLTPKEIFKEWLAGRKIFLMENFYRNQRKRLNILMDGDQPLAGEWNFDQSNRLAPPKNYQWPPYLAHKRDKVDLELIAQLRTTYPNLWGNDPDESWATTREGALLQLDYFLQNHFSGFGPYEDAIPPASESWQVHHSLLSPYLNNGLLHPAEVVEAALNKFEEGNIPIESCEGFIRQIIGWREYVFGMYQHFGPEYRKENQLSADRKLLPLFNNSKATQMECVRDTIEAIENRAWVHHIPRLMILSNLALLTGIKPEAFLDWMSEVFIDAYDWVMVPNIIGMGLHADGGAMMSKPYAAGGAYISRMSKYCSSCKFNPKLRVGEDACPFTTLYWDFLDRHREAFIRNPRIAQQVRGLDRLKDLAELRKRAEFLFDQLEQGKI
ncbi:MAG: cryptochrome/photolyase family protein [Actinomycetota bacterium]|nr:cryptochrome/photolyase family protein [Actinomycetota bacterium]